MQELIVICPSKQPPMSWADGARATGQRRPNGGNLNPIRSKGWTLNFAENSEANIRPKCYMN
jgi:hypothetical protein